MTPVALYRAFVAMGEAIRRTYVRAGRVTGRRAERFAAMLRGRWLTRGPVEGNRHERRANRTLKAVWRDDKPVAAGRSGTFDVEEGTDKAALLARLKGSDVAP